MKILVVKNGKALVWTNQHFASTRMMVKAVPDHAYPRCEVTP